MRSRGEIFDLQRNLGAMVGTAREAILKKES